MYKLYVSCVLTFGLLATGHVPAHADFSEVILGVLEHHVDYAAGMKFYFTVRAIFKNSPGEWQPFEHDCPNPKYPECLKTITSQYPEKVTWTISFDGKNLGRLSTVNPGEFQYYAAVGQQKIIENQKIPTIGRPSRDYGWGHEEFFRPLVAVSEPNYHDPDQWKPSHPKDKHAQLVREEFRKKFPKVENCAKKDVEKLKPWAYSDSHIKVVKSYSSNKNWTLIQLRLEPYLCDFMLDHGDPFLDHWFTVSPDKKVSYLGESLILVDAGDYDNDGQSEVIFQIVEHDFGGYKIFYKDFAKYSAFQFGLH